MGDGRKIRHPADAMTREIIHARTNGNPFFIEKVVQSLVEGGHLAGRRRAYRLATPIEMLQVPASVQAVLSSRIDRLREREKQVLQTAAVIGEALLGRVMASVTAIDDVDGFSRRVGSDQAKFVKIALRGELSARDARWSEAVAVGNLNFVEKMKSEKKRAASRSDF